MTAKRRTQASLSAESKFRARVAELGGTVLEDGWFGTKHPMRVRCPVGHESTPRPQSVNAGNGICERCGLDKAAEASRSRRYSRSPASESKFRARVAELGGTVLEDSWLGCQKPHRVVCSNGHEAFVRPNNVTQGSGICLTCTWSSQDVLYLVYDPARGLIKFGITSGDPKPRLGAHRRDGFTDVVAVRQGLPVGVAFRFEQEMISQLRNQGVTPVQGREYFDATHGPFILSAMDAYLP